MAYVTQGTTFTNRDSWQSVFTWYYLCHKCSYRIQNELYYSRHCLWFMCQLDFFFPDIKIIAWMVNHNTLLQKWSTVHIAWMNYSCRLTRISISRIFDKAKWDFTVWKAKGSRHFTGQFTSSDAFAIKTSKQVPRREIMKNDSIAQCHLLRWLQQNGWLMACFPMWLVLIVEKIFFAFLTSIQMCQSAKKLPVASLQPDFLYNQQDTTMSFFKSSHFNTQRGFTRKRKRWFACKHC